MAKQAISFPKANMHEVQAPEAQKALWLAMKAGDRQALGQIYELYIDDMFKFGMSLHARQGFVSDCIQEVFIELWKYKANISETNNIKLYLFKSLRNSIYQHLAREKKQTTAKDEPGATLVPSHEQLLIENQNDHELQSKLAHCIDKLPLRQREVIRYIFFDKYSYEETSHLMSISIRSVYTLAWKAISSLRKSV